MKLFRTDEEIVDLAFKKYNETSLPQIGIDMKVMSVTKAKQPLKVSKANATTEYLTDSDDMICLYVYEDLFDRLPDEHKEILMEGVLSNVAYDTEKDKLLLDNTQYGELLRMRKKYPNYVDIVETAQIILNEIAEEEKAKKEAEKENKRRK